jgi:hypothetical protein
MFRAQSIEYDEHIDERTNRVAKERKRTLTKEEKDEEDEEEEEVLPTRRLSSVRCCSIITIVDLFNKLNHRRNSFGRIFLFAVNERQESVVFYWCIRINK